jgi:hypothetical protein
MRLKAWLQWLFAVVFMVAWTVGTLAMRHPIECLVVWLAVLWFGALQFPRREP